MLHHDILKIKFNSDVMYGEAPGKQKCRGEDVIIEDVEDNSK